MRERALRHVRGVLEQPDVAGHQRRRGEPEHLPEREVPGHDGQHRPERLVADEAAARRWCRTRFVGQQPFGVFGVVAAGRRRTSRLLPAPTLIGLPISVVMSLPKRFFSRSRISAAWSIRGARSAIGIRRHSRKVRAAFSRRRSISASVIASKVRRVSPVAGLILAIAMILFKHPGQSGDTPAVSVGARLRAASPECPRIG